MSEVPLYATPQNAKMNVCSCAEDVRIQWYLAHKNPPPPQDPRHSSAVGSQRGMVYYGRGIPWHYHLALAECETLSKVAESDLSQL